jgi:hypothetical protein
MLPDRGSGDEDIAPWTPQHRRIARRTRSARCSLRDAYLFEAQMADPLVERGVVDAISGSNQTDGMDGVGRI